MFYVYKFKPGMLSSLVGLKIWVVRGHVGPASGHHGSVSVINCMAPNYETFVSHFTKKTTKDRIARLPVYLTPVYYIRKRGNQML